MNTAAATTASVDDRAFFGHPKGLFYLAFTEAWERFSFYGMTALKDWRVVGALVAVIVISIFQSTSYYQLYNVFKIWIQDHVDLGVGSFSIPVPWYQSLDALVRAGVFIPARRQAAWPLAG